MLFGFKTIPKVPAGTPRVPSLTDAIDHIFSFLFRRRASSSRDFLLFPFRFYRAKIFFRGTFGERLRKLGVVGTVSVFLEVDEEVPRFALFVGELILIFFPNAHVYFGFSAVAVAVADFFKRFGTEILRLLWVEEVPFM